MVAGTWNGRWIVDPPGARWERRGDGVLKAEMCLDALIWLGNHTGRPARHFRTDIGQRAVGPCVVQERNSIDSHLLFWMTGEFSGNLQLSKRQPVSRAGRFAWSYQDKTLLRAVFLHSELVVSAVPAPASFGPWGRGHAAQHGRRRLP